MTRALPLAAALVAGAAIYAVAGWAPVVVGADGALWAADGATRPAGDWPATLYPMEQP